MTSAVAVGHHSRVRIRTEAPTGWRSAVVGVVAFAGSLIGQSLIPANGNSVAVVLALVYRWDANPRGGRQRS